MPELTTDCPRCGAAFTTFDVKEAHRTSRFEHDWKQYYEVFGICRQCRHATIFVLSNSGGSDYTSVNKAGLMKFGGSLNGYMDNEGFINIRHKASVAPPDHLPKEIANAFNEGATCLAVECWNAAATMFRLCLDLATRPKLPKEVKGQSDPKGLNKDVRRILGLRMNWLFDNGKLPEDLRELSICVKDDGNDGAHAGTLKKEDAQDLLDFTTALLERLYTEPEKLKLAAARRSKRRKGK